MDNDSLSFITQNYDENQIVSLAKKGNEVSLSSLFQEFLPLIKFKATKFYEIGLEHEDFIQEGLLGLFFAILHFDGNNNASFKTFANLCIERRMISACKAASRNKHSPLNSSFSFDMSDSDDAISTNSSNPELIYIEKENLNEIEKMIFSNLSEFEKLSLHFFLQGFSYEEIGEKLNSSYKSVDNALQRVRKKMREIL